MLEEIGVSAKSRCDKQFYCGLVALGMMTLCALGIYFGVLGWKNQHSKNVNELEVAIEHWNESSFPILSKLELDVNDHIFNVTHFPSWVSQAKDLPSYTPLQFTGNVTIFTQHELQWIQVRLNEYRLACNTTLYANSSFALPISNVTVFKKEAISLPKNLCQARQVGCWLDHECYYHYILTHLCVVLDEATVALVEDYNLGCGLGSMEVFQAVPWLDCLTEPGYSGDVNITVLSINDPYVVSLTTQVLEIPPTAFYYFLIGGTLMLTSVLICICPLIFFCRKVPGERRPLKRTYKVRE